jgi:hypothetical protein
MNRTKLALRLLILAALLLAIPAMAYPPLCSCPFCYSNLGTTSCTLKTATGYTVVTCGYYIPRYCEGPP